MTKTSSIKKDYLTQKQTAEILGKPETWLQNDRYGASKGGKLKIPFIKNGNRVFYKREDILSRRDELRSLARPKLIPLALPEIQTNIFELRQEVDRILEDNKYINSRLEQLHTLENENRKFLYEIWDTYLKHKNKSWIRCLFS